MESTIFSIIIPTFNSGSTLNECLTSVVNQINSDFEVLIIDNLSQDNTLEIISEFSSKYHNIRWISESDMGIYDAMNKGIKIARGNWLYFLGSDDRLYDDNVLADISQRIKTSPHKIIYGNVLIDGDTGWAKNGQVYDGEFTFSKLIDRNICHQAILYHKSVFKKYGGYNQQYDICADWDKNLRLWSTYPFYYIDKIIAVFRGGNSSNMIANNYTEQVKWENIASYFKYQIITGKFSLNSQNFLELSRSYKASHNFMRSAFWRIVYLLNRN